jgi:hypothetical protein
MLIPCRADIIAMLILGVLFIVGFFLWERHVVYKTTRPPLMRLQLWTRANGRLASVYFIGFVSWMGFVVSWHRHRRRLSCNRSVVCILRRAAGVQRVAR